MGNLKDGSTLLYVATARGHIHIVKLLLSRGANVNETTDEGKSPLHAAASRGNFYLVKILMKARADPHAKDIDGVTPRDIIDRWPVVMTMICLKELGFYHYIDMSMIDLWQYIG